MIGVIKSFIGGLSVKEKRLFYIAVVSVFTAIFYWVIINPFVQESRNIEDRIDREKKMVGILMQFLMREENIKREDEEFDSYFLKGEYKEEEIIAQFLRYIEKLGKSHKISFTNISPVESLDKGSHIIYSLTFEGEATMEDLLKFLYDLEFSSQPVRIFFLQLFPKKREDNTVKCIVGVNKLVVVKDGYILKSKTESGPLE